MKSAAELRADAARFECLLSLGRRWGRTLEITIRFPLNKDPRDVLDEIIEAQKKLPPTNNRKHTRLSVNGRPEFVPPKDQQKQKQD